LELSIRAILRTASFAAALQHCQDSQIWLLKRASEKQSDFCTVSFYDHLKINPNHLVDHEIGI